MMLKRLVLAVAVVLGGAAGLVACQAPPPASMPVAGTVGAIEDAAWRPSAPPPRAGALDGFFNQLALLRTGAVRHVRILQIGDSHTAADFFSGQLRDDLRAKFGDAGIGTRVAGLPYLGLRQKDFTVTQSGLWTYHNSLREHSFVYGLSGFTAVSRSVGARLTLAPTDAGGFDTGFVDFARTPTGGTLRILLDGAAVADVSTAGPAGTLGHAAFVAPAGGARQLSLVAGARGIEILDWNVERQASGILLDSFGVVGATAGIFDVWNAAVVRRQLAQLRPALIILAYGTNEAASPALDAGTYAAAFGQMLADLHRWSPASSILVVAPTDGAHQDRDCLNTAAACPWETLPGLGQVRFIQARAAARYGAAYWDNSLPELQSGGIDAWVDMAPPLARPDHLHFTVAGYTILANSMYAWLMRGFGGGA